MNEIASTEPSEKVALITGSSRGIGAAVACALAQRGMGCALNYASDSSEDAAFQLTSLLHDVYGVQAKAFRADVSSFAEAKQLAADVKEHFGRIDVLVNNAGITRDEMVTRMSEDDFDRVIDVNLKGAFNCIRHVSKIMLRQRGGRIVNVSSVVGLKGNVGQANYAASKAGIIGLTKAVAKELAVRDITVNAVAPGFITTDMTAQLPDAHQSRIKDSIALGCFGQPEDVANAIAFFASDQARYITGQVLCVDGGLAL